MLLPLLTLLGVLALVIMACGSSTPTSVVASGTAQSTTAPKQTHYKVGQSVKIGDVYIVTVNSAKRSGGDVVLDVTFKNLSNEDQDLSTALQCDLKDSTGQKLDQDIFVGHAPDGTLAAGDTVRGQIAYKAPRTEHSFTFLFEADLLSSGQTIWDLHI
jgi:uncharacterized protein DUF4352